MAPDTARQKAHNTGPIQHGTQEATGYKQRKSIDHTRLKLSRGESLLDFIREAQDQGPRAKYIHALHSAENPYFSYFLWAMFVFGIIIETCMYTFSASPAGLSLGMNVQKNYFSERTWFDLETRMKQLSSLPVLVKVNDQTNGYFNKKSMTFDDTNSFWENPFFTNDRAILQPVCNPSFTLPRAIAGRSAENPNPVGKHFIDNNFNASATNGGTDYWWNMRRIDFAVGEGLVGMYDLDSTSTEFSFDSWLNYRKCVVQGAHEIPTDSAIVDALKKQGLIHADILPANMYESFEGFKDQARLGVPQTGLFLWDSLTSLDVTQDLFDSVVELKDILVCETKSPDTQFSSILKSLGLNSGSGIACTDYTAASTCSCKYQPHITEVVSEIDSLQKLMHAGEKQLVRTSNNAIMSMKSAWRYLLTTILPILVFIPGLYFPPAKYVNRTLMSTAIRLLAIYNIYNLQLVYLNPLFAASNGFCFKKRVHQFVNKIGSKAYDFDSVDKSAEAESVHVLQEIFPGFECTWAPGTVFVIWKIVLNWLYLFTSFLKKHPETQRLAFNKSDYSKFRVKYPDSKRGVHPTQLFSWLMVLGMGVLLFYSQGMSLFGFQTSGIMKPSTLDNLLSFGWLKNSAVLSSVSSMLLSIDLSQASLAESTLNFGYSVTPILLLFIASYLADTNDNGSFSNRPYEIQQKHFKFILPMLVVVMPFQSMFRMFETGFLGADYIEETYGANFAIIFLYLLNLPKYIVYINTLNIISNQIGDLYFFQFQVFKYAIVCLCSVMIMAFGIFSMNCNFSQRSSSFENYALVDKYTGIDGAMLEGHEAIGSKFKIDNDFQSLCGRGYNAHGWPWVIKNKPELSRSNIKMKQFYAERHAKFEQMINDDEFGGANLTSVYLGAINNMGVLDTTNDKLTISKYRSFTAREIYAVDNDDGQNMTHLMNDAEVWQSTYNIDTFITLCYGVLQIMANAGIGDIPPNSVYEQALAIVLFMISLFFIQTKLTFVLENAAMSIFVEKIEFLKNAGGCIFIHHTPSNEHRIDRTVSLLWRHWEIWKGINPLCSVSTDTMYLPLPIKQKMNYFVLEELLRRNKSLALSRLSQAQLKNMSEGLVYNIIHANDVVLSSLKEQNYILFVKSGCLRISNAEDELADCFNLEKNTCYFERECYLGKPVDYTIRCHSDYSEFYTISRSHFFKVINQSDNVGELMNKMKINSATMKLLERKMRARDNHANIKHIVTKELPVQLQGEVLTKPFLAGHNTVSVNYYSDLQNYKFLTPRFMHSFESSLTLKNMPTDFLNLKYASDSCVRNNKQVMAESYGRWLSQEYIDSLSAMEFRLFKDWKTSSDETGIYLQGPQKHYSAYLKEVREQIRIERTEILRDLREQLKIVKTGDGGKGLLIRETMFRNRLGSYDINMNRRAIKDMFGKVSETLFGAGNELEEIHGIVIDPEEENERVKSTGNKRATAANTKISSKAKNSMRQSDAKKVTKKEVNAQRASDAKKVSTKDKNATRKSKVKEEKVEKPAKNSDDSSSSSSSGSSSGSSSSSSAASSSSSAASSSDVASSSSESSIYSEKVVVDDIDSIGSDLHDEDERFFQFTPGSNFLYNWHRFKAIHSVACFWLLSMNWSFYDDDEYRVLRDPDMPFWTNGRNIMNGYAIIAQVWGNIYYFLFLDCIIYFNVIVGMYTGTMNDQNTIIWDPVNKLKRMPIVDKIITMIGIIPWRLVAKPLTFLGNTASKRTLMVGMMKIIYLYWTSTGKLRMISYKLYGSFFTNFLNTLIQLFFFVQLAVCFAYKIDCSLTKEHKVNYYLNGICRQGSWAWTEFGEYSFDNKQRIGDLPITRYKKSLIWIYKHFTAVGNSGIFASYASSRIMLSLVLILGVVMLSKVIAGLASLTGMTVGSGLKGDRKAHFRLVESLIDRTKNTELFDRIVQTKRQIFNAYNGYCLPGYFEVEDCLYPVDKLIVKYETFNPIICQIHLFKGLPSTIRHKLVQLEQTKQYAKGQVVIHQQEIVPFIYFIRYGCVKVSRNGEEHGYLESTQSFNTLAMMSSQPSKYTFTCVTGCEIIEWSYKDIKSCMGPAWKRLYDREFILSCKEKLEKLAIPPRQVDMEYIEKSREESALNHMRDYHPEVSDKVMESDGTFNPTSANYQLWSLFNAYRIIANIIMSLGFAAVYYDSGTAKAFLLLLDVFAMINMWVTSKVQRKNNQTKMFTKKKLYSWLYYKSNGLVFDILCIVLPSLLDMAASGYNYTMSYYHLTIPVAACLRLLQLRHLGQYFSYKHETKMGVSYQMILYRIYQMLILVCFSASFGIILATDEDAIAKYYTAAEVAQCKSVFKQTEACEDTGSRKVIDSKYLWGSYSYGITLPKSGEISIECRNMDMFKGPSNITVAQGSWLGQAFKYKYGLQGQNTNIEQFINEPEVDYNRTEYQFDPTSQWYHVDDASHNYDPPKEYFSGIDFQNNHHIAILALYYWANVVTSTSASVLIPMKNTHSQLFEIFMQMLGLYYMVMICVEFKNVGEVLDRARQKASLTYHQLNVFFKNTEEVRTGSPIHKLMQRQLVLNYQTKSHHLEKQIFSGLPPATAKDLAADRYGEVLQKAYITEADPHRRMLRTRDFAVNVYKLAAVGGTQVLKNKQITNDVYFIADGSFVSEVDNSDRYHKNAPSVMHRVELPVGSFIVPDGLAESQITAVTDGMLYVVSRDAFYTHHKTWCAAPLLPGVHLPMDSPKFVNVESRKVESCKMKSHHKSIKNMQFGKCESLAFKIPPWFGLVGIIMATLNWVQGDVQILAMADLVVGVLLILYIVANKTMTNDFSYNIEELLSIFACLPIPFEYRWIVRASFFYLEDHYYYARASYDLAVKLYVYRIIKYATWMISICAVFAGSIKLVICGTGNDCDWNSILLDARDRNGFLMELDGNDTWTYPKDLTERPDVPFYTFTNLFYAVFDSFTSTGFGNLRPRKAGVMLIFSVVCIAGRIFVAALLGLGGDVLEQELHAIHSDYLSLRNRIKHYLRKAGCNDTRVGYVCNFIDADYRKTMHFDIRDTLAGTCISPGLRRDFFFELFGETIKSINFFSDCSNNCISEICDRAASIEYYYAGNIVQEADTAFLGMIIIMKGSLVVDDTHVKVKGDTVFDDIIDRQVPAHLQVKAFSECQIVRLDWQITRAILQLYKKDYKIVLSKIRSNSHSFG
jgi:CRP-like cAMP-binding protein